MITQHELLTDSRHRPLQLRVRPDLVVDRQTYLGRSYWVVKDPLSLKFYRFEEEEYVILRMIDGNTSPAEIQRRFERQFAPQRLALGELQSLVSRLFQSSLIVADAAAQGEQLLRRHRRRRRQELHAAWTNVLSIRFAGVNPDRFLHWLNRHCGWLYAWPSVVACLLLVCAALLMITARFDLFIQRLPGFHQFLAADNWLLLILVLAGTKVLHELGHGLACKRFGGECHEMGLMLLVLTPCLYCNVSDSWMVRSKWRRAAIGAAGMYVELILASICTLLWWVSDVGLLHYLCLDIMFVCSVSTLLFNANPLLRYDGYFILSDLLEIPNLRQKASTVVHRMLSRYFLGLSPEADSFLPQRRQWLFLTYAVAAWIYRWIVVACVLWFLYKVFEPQGLKVIGQLLVVFALYGLLLTPAWQFVHFLRVPGRLSQLKKMRMTAILALTAGLLAAFLLIPLPHCVTCTCTMQRRGATAYVDVPGTLVEIHVQQGQPVCAGQTLVVLKNVDIELAIQRLAGERELLSARLDALRLQAYDSEAALLDMAEVAEAIASLDRRIERRRQDLDRLVVRAPRAGRVLSAPPLTPLNSPETLPFWTGHPLQPENLTAHLQEGTAVCHVGDPHQLEAVLEIDETAIEFIQRGQKVELYPHPLGGRALVGQIAQISNTELQATPASFSVDAQVKSRHDNKAARLPLTPWNVYQANVPLDTHESLVLPGVSGRAKIHAGRRTVGRRLWNAVCRTFHFDL